MSATRWVDVIHTETSGRARIPREALAAHKALGWVVDTDPEPHRIDPTDPVATSTPEDAEAAPEPELEDEANDEAGEGDGREGHDAS